MQYIQSKNNIIIILVVAIFAVNALILIQQFGVNIPRNEEWYFVSFIEKVHNGKDFWSDTYFQQLNEQRPIVPNILLAADVMLESWNTVHLMYLGWMFIVITVVTMYVLLRDISYRARWIIIPISALLFGTEQFGNMLWGFTGTSWFGTMAGITLAIFFLNRPEKKTSIVFAVIAASFASFCTVIGMTVWIVGIISISRYQNKKNALFFWVSSAFAVLLLYTSGFNFGVRRSNVSFSLEYIKGAFDFVTSFISNGVVAHFNIFNDLRFITGLVILVILIIIPIYLLKKNNFRKEFLPWLQFGIIGILGALITTYGRYGLEDPVNSRYATIAVFGQIAAVVFIVIAIIQFRKRFGKTVKLFSSIFLICIFIIFLASTQYAGHIGATMLNKEMIAVKECITNPSYNLACITNSPVPEKLANDIQTLKENNLGPFSEDIVTLSDKLFEIPWDGFSNTLNGTSNIDSISYVPLKKINNVQKDRMFIPISGWAIAKKEIKPYVFVDEKINTKADYGYISESARRISGDAYSGWRGIIDLRDITVGCHDVSVRFVNQNEYFKTESIQICLE